MAMQIQLTLTFDSLPASLVVRLKLGENGPTATVTAATEQV